MRYAYSGHSTRSATTSERSESSGGEGGIRTHGRLSPTTVFKTVALDHSATSPGFRVVFEL